MKDDDDPWWKELLTNELLWVVVAVLGILGLAFTWPRNEAAHRRREDRL
ncbi:MAG: hypothetical protein JO332_20550 [Planctomycetaceae bacterium]|nr:hypothetical protein [Planctomycetaceae bacterium]